MSRFTQFTNVTPKKASILDSLNNEKLVKTKSPMPRCKRMQEEMTIRNEDELKGNRKEHFHSLDD